MLRSFIKIENSDVDLFDPGVSNNLFVDVVGLGGVTYNKSFFLFIIGEIYNVELCSVGVF